MNFDKNSVQTHWTISIDYSQRQGKQRQGCAHFGENHNHAAQLLCGIQAGYLAFRRPKSWKTVQRKQFRQGF